MEKLAGLMDYGPQDMADSFRAARKDTVRIAEDIDEKDYDFAPTPECRTVVQILAHLAFSPKVQQRYHSINRFDKEQGAELMRFAASAAADERTPRTKAAIVAMLREGGEQFAQWLESLSPDFLNERVAVEPGRTKTRFEVLLRVKEHELHHRGQLMLIERLLGLVPHTTRVRAASTETQSTRS
jgi:uncharacterized damage-inducible protein DinB